MGQLKQGTSTTKQITSPSIEDDANELSYVRIDNGGRIIAVFNDNTEMDVSELFSKNIADN